MVRTVVTAAAGRMGDLVARLVRESAEFEWVGATENPQGPWMGRQIEGIPVRGTLAEALSDARGKAGGADVVIDFSRPEIALANVEACAETGTALVLATTGLTSEQSREAKRFADRLPLLIAPNLSTGIQLMLALVAEAAKALGPEFDLEISEIHHRFKRDAPSGTALALGEALARARGTTLEASGRFERHGQIGERPAGEIGLQTLRGGDVAGEHTVYFLGEAERLEITHRATSREPFARGALRAARFLAGQKPGLYTMAQVLGL